MHPNPVNLGDQADTHVPSAWRGWLPVLAVLLAVALATITTLVLISTPAANAETPAERCARETAAYNSAWAQTWAASNGKPANQAPPPPVPYVCVDPGPPTSSTTPPPSVTAPTIPTETNTPDTGGPNIGAHAPTDIPTAGQTPIVPIPGQQPPPGTPRVDPPTPAAAERPQPLPEIPGRVEVDRAGEPAAPTRSIDGQARPAEIPGDQATYDIVSKSPTLQAQWKQIKDDWRVEYRDGEGSYTSYRDRLVVIQKGSPTAEAQLIAHEFGHAVYPLTIDHSSTESCINSQLDNEGAATFNNIKIQREIIANGGPDIGIAGGNEAGFNAIYDEYLGSQRSDAEYQKAIRKMGAFYGENLNPSTAPELNYRQYYEKGCN